jgi:hypothetical protein
MIIGCDVHSRYQVIAMLEPGTGEVVDRRLEHENGEAGLAQTLIFDVSGGWRIYEGGGGVKGKVLMFCFVGRSEQPPYLKLGGCERSHTFPWTPLRHIPLQFSASFSSLIYPVARTRRSIPSRERPNQTWKVDVPTMRHPRCAPELFLRGG